MTAKLSNSSAPKTRSSRFHQLCLVLFEKQLNQLAIGQLVVNYPQGTIVVKGDNRSISCLITVTDMQFFESVVLAGSVGAAESYMRGEWQCDDLTKLIRLLVLNRHIVDDMEGGMATAAAVVMRFVHWLRRNTPQGSRKNIAAHYDLGNELFALFLDRDHMMYSSAMYFDDEETLEQAQFNKLKRLCDKLDLQPDDHLLEIGTGWGGCATFAALHYGCKVTSITISKAQYQAAIQRVIEFGLEDKVTILLEDYRDLKGQYDKLISIEMVEAVGHHFINDYFQHCSALLKPDGLAVIQAITLEDHRYDQAVKAVDFIKRYIFPGSFIPSVSVLVNAAGQAELKLVNMEDLGMSYAKTLREWRTRFFDALPAVKQLGYDDQFIRMWEFYLSYCEGGFIERSISDVHLLFGKTDNRRPSWLPEHA